MVIQTTVVTATVMRSDDVIEIWRPFFRAKKKPIATTKELSIAEISLQALMRHQNQRSR